jgi:hypothetical protein
MDRERSQLVIALGEGPEGQRLREVLDRAAERAGKPVSVWARETLFVAAGDTKSEGAVDPIVEVRLNGNEVTLLDLRAVAGMQNGWSNKVRAFVGGAWQDLGTAKPDELVERWKRVRTWGAA